MQPIISQALLATRVADMHQRAEIAHLAADVKRARRRARRLGRSKPAGGTQPDHGTQPACRPDRVGLSAM